MTGEHRDLEDLPPKTWINPRTGLIEARPSIGDRITSALAWVIVLAIAATLGLVLLAALKLALEWAIGVIA